MSALGKTFAGIVIVRLPGLPDDVGFGMTSCCRQVRRRMSGKGAFVSDTPTVLLASGVFHVFVGVGVARYGDKMVPEVVEAAAVRAWLSGS